jgi:uncharacterized MAPEG superfamily protein
MLVYSAALLFVLIMVQAQAATTQEGLGRMAGPRDDVGPPTGFALRAKRTANNHIEGLVVFAPLLLAAVLAHRTDHWTALGAELFFFSRLAHAALYLLGVPWVRTIAFLVGVAGMALIFLADLTVL